MGTSYIDLSIGLLARLRALRHFYETAHWLAYGNSYYGDHLLYERLYDEVDGEIDGLAEKVIPLFGDDTVDLYASLLQMARVLAEDWAIKPDDVGSPSIAQLALNAEEEVQCYISYMYEILEEEGALSLGFDDFLQALASKLESHLYLLGRRTKQANTTPNKDRVLLASSTMSSSLSLLEDVLIEIIEDPEGKHLPFDLSVAVRKILVSLSDLATQSNLTSIAGPLTQASKLTTFNEDDIGRLTVGPAQRVLPMLKEALRDLDLTISKPTAGRSLSTSLQNVISVFTKLLSAMYFKTSSPTVASLLRLLKGV